MEHASAKANVSDIFMGHYKEMWEWLWIFFTPKKDERYFGLGL